MRTFYACLILGVAAMATLPPLTADQADASCIWFEDGSGRCGDEPVPPNLDLWEQIDLIRETEGVEVA